MDRSRWVTLGQQSAVVAAALAACFGLWAQPPGGGQGKGGGAPKAPATAKSQAPMDLTGYWVSIVTEDWLYRMVTPAKAEKGKQADVSSLTLTPAARTAANNWDPAKDDPKACLAYGPVGITRIPGRIHIDWSDDNTLKFDYDAGTQTRMLAFGQAPAAAPPAKMGTSTVTWEGMGRGKGGGAPAKGGAPAVRPGSLRVVTRNMTPGYIRKNGVPYSAQAVLSEWYDIVNEPNGDQYLIVSSVIEDPVNLTGPFRTSTHFKREPNGSKFAPNACTVN